MDRRELTATLHDSGQSGAEWRLKATFLDPRSATIRYCLVFDDSFINMNHEGYLSGFDGSYALP